MKLTNKEIYTYANNLLVEFNNTSNDLKLPIKLNFYLQKNIQILKALAIEIEENRLNIIKQYGTLNDNGTDYTIPKENYEKATKELNELYELEQEVQIYKVSIDALSDDLMLTTKQMEALLFMIE